MDHSLITQNDGIDEGGILSIGGSVIVKKSTISDKDGAGITLSSGTLRMTDSTVSGNRCAPDAGGINVGGGSATIIRSTDRKQCVDRFVAWRHRRRPSANRRIDHHRE